MSKLVKACIGLAAFVALAVVPASGFAVNDPLVIEQSNTQKLSVTHENPINVLGTLAKDSEGKTTEVTLTGPGGEILVRCPTATMTGKLETNTGIGPGTGTVEATITTFDISGHEAGNKCNGGALFGPFAVTTAFEPEGNGVPYCIRATPTMATDEFQVRGNSCTKESRPITIVLDTTNIGICRYIRSAAIPGIYATHPSDAVITLSKVEIAREAGSSIFCPAVMILDMSLTLSTDTAEEQPLSILNQ